MLMIRGIINYPAHLRQERERRVEVEVETPVANRVKNYYHDEAKKKAKARRQRFIDAGICLYCKKEKAREGKRKCETCGEIDRQRKAGKGTADWNAAKEAARKANLCIDCKKEPRSETSQCCKACRDDRTEKQRQRRERARQKLAA